MISTGAHQAIEFQNPIRMLFNYEMTCLPKRFRFEGNKQVGADRDSRPEPWEAPCAGLAPTVSICSVSTASANIRRAHAVHPVSALQREYSAPFQRPPSAQVL
jgi:hypothetical protein